MATVHTNTSTLYQFEQVVKKIEDGVVWYVLNLKTPINYDTVYNSNALTADQIKELISIRKTVIDNLLHNDSLFSKKPSATSLSTISPPYYTLPENKWSPVVKWNSTSALPHVFRIELISIYISRSLIVPMFAFKEHKEDVIDLEWGTSTHPDLEEYDIEMLETSTDTLTLRNLKKEREMAKQNVKSLFKKAYDAKDDFISKYGELDYDVESTFSDSDSESGSKSDSDSSSD
jgi:hypothetical protein